MAKVSDIFNIQYGNSLVLNNLTQVEEGVAFVSRTSKNNGVSAIVEPIEGVDPFPAGCITVALSSMSVLETNVQPFKFYTGYHIAVLTPKREMCINEKLFYCLCIEKNKYRYYFGRQANRTLADLNIPDTPPAWVYEKDIDSYEDISLKFDSEQTVELESVQWKKFKVCDLFESTTGKGPFIRWAKKNPGDTPLVSSSQYKNGIVQFVNCPANHPGNSLTLAKNGSVGEIFYQPTGFVATADILVLVPKITFDVYIGMFIIAILKKEKHRYHWGRKWNKDLLDDTYIPLPCDEEGALNYEFMRNYIKTLSFSKFLE